MRFAVSLLRHRGRPLPREEVFGCRAFVGDVRIEEIRDEVLMRYVRIARVLVLERPRAANVLAELFEPVIIAMNAAAFTLSGVERCGEQAFAQGWLVRDPREDDPP
jgi:hypothetical protein